MWDKVIIGKGYSGSSAMRVKDLKIINISQNETSYWISNAIFDIDGCIFKDTIEGEELTKCIEGKVPEKTLVRLINSWFLNKLINHDTDSLLFLIKKENEKFYKKGQDDKAKEIRAALNIAEV